MSQLGPVVVSLTVAFAVFLVVLAVQLYYVWRSRQRRRAVEARGARSSDGSAVLTAVEKWANWTTWRDMAQRGCNWMALRAKEAKNWSKHSMLRKPMVRMAVESSCVEAEAPPLEAIEEPEAAEEADEEDIFKLGGLWGPPRLLFTITEETKEEMMDLEVVRSRVGGKGSRRASRASSELVFVPSACSSPYVTPPSSPYATPFGSPGPMPPTKIFIDVDSTSSSTTSSSSSPPPNHRPLSSLFEETSSFSSSSATSSSATPATLSPPPPPTSAASPKRQSRPLGLLFEPPPSPSSALYNYHNRVHPLSPPSFRLINIDGNPILASSPPISPPIPPTFSPPRFCIPAPSQPTTPSPFRSSSYISPTKPNGFLIFPKVKPAYLAEV